MDPRPFEELRDSGLLWLINRAVFHPRGFALALTVKSDNAVGWELIGDGSDVWQFAGDEQDHFRRAEATLRGQATRAAVAEAVTGAAQP